MQAVSHDQGEEGVAANPAVTPALPVVIPFLLTKLHLERGDVQLALQQLQRMALCDGYQPQLLEVGRLPITPGTLSWMSEHF